MTRFFRVAAFSIIGVLSLGTMLAVSTPSAKSQFGRNLVVNGGAEEDVGAANDTQIVKPTGWTTTGEFTAVQYGIPGGFPDRDSPGPRHRGKNDFEGGNAARSTASQAISLRPSLAAIKSGTVRYTFSAWLGGFSNQDDHATATVTFRNTSGMSVGSAMLGPVTPEQRHDVTGLWYRSRSGRIPNSATQAIVTVAFTRFEGSYNDGSADNISLVLNVEK